MTLDLTTAATDPFGKLSAGEMFRFYSNTASYTTGTTVANGIALATSGTFWASTGLPSTVGDGYAYTTTDTGVINATNTLSFSALNFINFGSYNAGDLNLVNDNGESLKGGNSSGPGIVCTAADIANPLVSCTDIVTESKIGPNTNFLSTSPWMFTSYDPALINRVPEPETVVLFGIGLLALGATRRRKTGKTI